MNRFSRKCLIVLWVLLSGCAGGDWNNPYSNHAEGKEMVLYQSFSERPKHLDPAVAYSENEYIFIAQIYEPPLQYHYLKRPYQLVPSTAVNMPEVRYFGKRGELLPDDAPIAAIDYSEYLIELKPAIRFQPHPALAQDANANYLYHRLTAEQVAAVETLADFEQSGSRELTAEDYVYQIKRLAHPKVQSPVAEIMKHYIVGFGEFAEQIGDHPVGSIRNTAMTGASVVDRYRYRIRIKGKYPQFLYWLAMPFFAPMPWEADAFYQQPGLADKNISLDWYPIGSGPYFLAENNPNRRMILQKNPLFHPETYPSEGEPEDAENGLLQDAGKLLPFIDKVVVMLERETIPYWNKFLQGYYDSSGIASDSFDQAVQFTGSGGVMLTDNMRNLGIQLRTAVETSIFYLGFNMLDPVIGGDSDRARKLRQALSIAIDYEEFIAIFRNERGVAAQGAVPPGIFGHVDGEAGVNPVVYDWLNGKPRRKPLAVARRLLAEAGYPNGIDPATREPLILYFDTTAVDVDDRPTMNWYRKQFEKLGIKLVIRATDYNRFQQKMRSGNAQLFLWGWNADYPDPENFFSLLYGPNGKVKHGGENASNYHSDEFDLWFEQMRNMENNEERFRIIQQMQTLLRRDAPWIFGLHPKTFSLYHQWDANLKPNLMANNRLKYIRIDSALRAKLRSEWNRPVLWPLLLAVAAMLLLCVPAIKAYRHKARGAVSASDFSDLDASEEAAK